MRFYLGRGKNPRFIKVEVRHPSKNNLFRIEWGRKSFEGAGYYFIFDYDDEPPKSGYHEIYYDGVHKAFWMWRFCINWQTYASIDNPRYSDTF